MKPLQREVNQTLSHLKTIQYFIDNRGADIAREVSWFIKYNFFKKKNYYCLMCQRQQQVNAINIGCII